MRQSPWQAGALALLVLALSACTATATRQSTGESIDDAAMKTRVKADLIRDPITKARDIDVEVFKGTVLLSGFVDSSEEKREAGEVARSVDNVKAVDNRLVVKSSP